jgi:acetylornithine deacetylase/succinyl-diaminopimelate desuccinylase-like protein
MLKLTVLLLSFTVGVAAVIAGITRKSTGVVEAADPTSTQLPAHTTSNPVGTIDGAQNPELIPDGAAYSILFRLISNRQSDVEKERIRAYIRQMGLGDQACPTCPYSAGAGDADIDALIAIADQFQHRIGTLDMQVKEIKDHNWPNPSAEIMVHLTKLQQQKEVVVAELVASLQMRLSPAGSEKVRRHINESVKRKIKITPGPTTPPGGVGWRPHSPGQHR